MASKNAITDFKNALAGGVTTADEMAVGAAAYMIDLYKSAYAKIYTALMTARKEINYATYLRQTQLLKQIGAILTAFKSDAGDAIEEDIRRVANHTSTLVIKHIETLGANPEHTTSFYQDYNSKYVEATINDSCAHIAAQTTRMSEAIKRGLREDTSQIMRRAAVEGLTRKEATKALRTEILGRDPTFSFIDKAGRAWDSEKYFQMLTRTTMHNVQREVYINTLTGEGRDLVIVSEHNAHDECGGWEGKVLSLTGATEGYPTLEDAISGGLFHPNCKHRLMAYDEAAAEIFGGTIPEE